MCTRNYDFSKSQLFISQSMDVVTLSQKWLPHNRGAKFIWWGTKSVNFIVEFKVFGYISMKQTIIKTKFDGQEVLIADFT